MGSQELGVRSSLYIRLFFLCIAGLLAAFAVFEHRKSKEKKEVQRQETLIFKNEIRRSIVKLSLIKQDGSQFILEKKNLGWQLIQPVNDLASSSAVEGLIDDLFNEEAQVLSEEDLKWSDYDLDPPFSTLSLYSANEQWNIGISGEPSFDGKFYIKKDQKLLLASARWSSLSRPWTDTYRSKALYSKKGSVSKLYYKKPNESYELIQKEGKWQWSLKISLSQRAVEDLIDLLKGDMISAFLNKTKVPFSKVDLEIKIFSEDQEDPWVLKLKKISEEKSHVILSDRDFIYELNMVEPLLTVGFKEKEPDSSENQSKEPLSETK